MRAIVTGQVGMDKKTYLDSVGAFASEHSYQIPIYHVGDMMYGEAPDVKLGSILDLPLSRLNALRRSVFKDIITDACDQPHLIVNTHATFRWRHGLFSAFDFDQLERLEPDMLICLVDNIDMVHHRLHTEHTIDATLKDLMVWREEEIMATELVARALKISDQFYVLSRGRCSSTIESCFRLLCQPQVRKVYPSFPMTHVVQMPETRSVIDAFRTDLGRHFVAFDPGDVDEKLLLDSAMAAAEAGKDFILAKTSSTDGGHGEIRVSVKQILDIAGDIDGQIYTRDFKLIDQSDMIVSLIPELPGGVPALSSGVERELQHAFEHGKEVYVVWTPNRNPSPFITETSTGIFKSIEEAMRFFGQQGMFHQASLFER